MGLIWIHRTYCEIFLLGVPRSSFPLTLHPRCVVTRTEKLEVNLKHDSITQENQRSAERKYATKDRSPMLKFEKAMNFEGEAS